MALSEMQHFLDVDGDHDHLYTLISYSLCISAKLS